MTSRDTETSSRPGPTPLGGPSRSTLPWTLRFPLGSMKVPVGPTPGVEERRRPSRTRPLRIAFPSHEEVSTEPAIESMLFFSRKSASRPQLCQARCSRGPDRRF